MNRTLAEKHRKSPLATPTALGTNATADISGALTALLADVFALYLKTKNFHWHMSGPHFRDYHLMLDEQGEQIFAMTDDIAERARKIGGTTLRSISHISRLQRLLDNDADFVTPADMLAELRDDNLTLVSLMKATHNLCEDHGDIATASLIENWVDEAERRARVPVRKHPRRRMSARNFGEAHDQRTFTVPSAGPVGRHHGFSGLGHAGDGFRKENFP